MRARQTAREVRRARLESGEGFGERKPRLLPAGLVTSRALVFRCGPRFRAAWRQVATAACARQRACTMIGQRHRVTITLNSPLEPTRCASTTMSKSCLNLSSSKCPHLTSRNSSQADTKINFKFHPPTHQCMKHPDFKVFSVIFDTDF